MKIVLYIANTSWYLYNFRMNLMISMRERGYHVIAIAPKDQFSSNIEKEGIDFISIAASRKAMNFVNDIKLIITLFKLFKQYTPFIVHNFTIKTVLLGTFAAQLARIPKVVNSIDGLGHIFSHKKSILTNLISVLFKMVFKFSKCILIVLNPDDRDYFIQNKIITNKKIFLINGAGINADEFSNKNFNIKKINYVDETKVNFFLFSRMIWDKGIKEYIDAALNIFTQFPSTHFYLVGASDPGNPTGIPLSWLKNINKLLGVSWIDYVDDVKPWLVSADIVVLPSLYREGIPLSLLEAASFEKPIITADGPGCKEIVKNKVNGILVPPGDSSALESAMKYLLDNRDIWKKMGSEGRKLVLDKFDEKLIVKETIDLYNKI